MKAELRDLTPKPPREVVVTMSEPTDDLWVDDAKPAPEGVAVARTYDDAVRMMRRFSYRVLFLDHDLGDPQGRTGLDLLRQMIAEGRCPRDVECISWNPVGRANINAELLRRVVEGA